jgi:predicted  nucleic acid-binding Zn-ribbon protein
MGTPALKLEFEEVTVEERLARVESHVEHIQSDVSEIKGDIRRLDAKIDAVKGSLETKIDSLKDSIVAHTVSNEKARSKLIVWALTLYVTLAAGLLTVMGHGFHWF